MEADFTMGRARHLIHLFLLLFLGYASAQLSEIYYSNSPGGSFSKAFDNTSLNIFSPASGLAPNGSGLCLTQPIDNLSSGDESARSEAAGRGLYKTPVQVRDPATKIVHSFSTMFSFWIESNSLYQPGHGFAFVWAPDNTSTGSPGMYLGWLNNSTEGAQLGNFAVEFDTVQNEEFDDPKRFHVGVNVNSMRSLASCTSEAFGYQEKGEFKSLNMTTSQEARVYSWITYDSSKNEINVTVSPEMAKPEQPLLTCVCNLSNYIQSETMYVGFTASTGSDSNGQHLSQHTVYEWSFGIGKSSAVNLFGTDTILSERQGRNRPKVAVILIATIIPCVVVLVLLVVLGIFTRAMVRRRKNSFFQNRDLILLESVRGPQKFSYRQLSAATKSFSKSTCIGGGGFGNVYRGAMPKRCEVLAVKRISKTSKQGAAEFVAEVKVIGCVRHRNLVPLLGWCHDVGRGELLLVYEYMPNGSLDQFLFKKDESKVLTWERRVNVLCGVGSALTFLHEEWDQRVVHRDVKASNVMLDANFNARLGDFGLARLYDHSQDPMSTLNLAGTIGYMAPELFNNGKPTEKTDVYSFGGLALEVATGIKASAPFPDNATSLVDWVWGLYRNDRLLEAADGRLEGNFDPDEMALVLQVGLLSSHPDPDARPTMRQSLAMLKGEIPLRSLPLAKPLPSFAFSIGRSESVLFTESTTRKTDFDDGSVNCENTTSSTRSSSFDRSQQFVSVPPR